MFIDALNRWDYDKLMSVFDDSLEHRILPKSLGRPVLTKKLYGDYFKGMMPVFKKFHITLHEVIEANDKITAHASSVGESAHGVPYSNEYTFITHFTPASRMYVVKEFVDSASSRSFFADERARAMEKKEREERERREQREREQREREEMVRREIERRERERYEMARGRDRGRGGGYGGFGGGFGR